MKEKLILSAIMLLCVICIAGCKTEQPEPVHIEIKQPAKKHVVIFKGEEKMFECVGEIRYKHNEDGLTDIIVQMYED